MVVIALLAMGSIVSMNLSLDLGLERHQDRRREWINIVLILLMISL